MGFTKLSDVLQDKQNNQKLLLFMKNNSRLFFYYEQKARNECGPTFYIRLLFSFPLVNNLLRREH